ncbi:hypothetical protein [Serratia marcescens]|uniref:Morphogenetic protein n=1 Tax=Serratia marcescens TaxID=615 RepID=A0ABD5IEP7_SERMA|nr:hypothetical protein [Serratia marcescens]MDX7082527.1 hypothetical protein [Serratia marcescens]
MKERPVIFNSEMVRAILDGRKTQTRRVIKLSHERGMVNPVIRGRNGEISSISCRLAPTLCPFGQVGDRLWVRETFGMQVRRDGLGGTGEFRVYRASNPDAVKYTTACGKSVPVKWTPSIHMPRRASRILLEITAVRVERLNSISEEDAKAEGVRVVKVRADGERYCDYQSPEINHYRRPSDSFISLWESIYGEESWQDSPWVWVIEFKRVGVGK